MSTITILELIIILIPWGSMEPVEKDEVSTTSFIGAGMKNSETKNFYYSAKQDASMMQQRMPDHNYHKTEVFINGKFSRYSEMTSKNKPTGLWDDYKFIGIAPAWYVRIDGVVQHDDLRGEL